MSKIEAYASEIPDEIRHAINAFDHDFRAAIFVVLLKNDELAFSEIRNLLNIDKKAKLTYHLSKLTKGALVEHHYKHEVGVDKYSFYSLTNFGKNFARVLGDALEPEPIKSWPEWKKKVTAGGRAFSPWLENIRKGATADQGTVRFPTQFEAYEGQPDAS